jgi:pimeloyl-ACP methyl ester carboxylesterase
MSRASPILGELKTRPGRRILLVHGLGRTPCSLFGLASALRRDGHHIRFFGYSPTLESVPHIVSRLARRLIAMSRNGEPIGLAAHSLGGVLLRMALVQAPEVRVHHLVMLGTPNQPSKMAAFWRRLAPFRWITRDCGRFLASPDAIPALPPPTIPVTLIAGTAGPRHPRFVFGTEPNDGIVSVNETKIHDADEPILVAALHSFIMDHPAARDAVRAAMMTSRTPRG